jgi:outer membrane biosynthesis protein TonB
MNLRGLAFPSFTKIIALLSLAYLGLLLVHPASAPAQSAGKVNRKVVERVEPEYPDLFRSGHFEGRIVAEATVQPSGNVSKVEIKAGNPMFASFAAKALMKWKYAPGPDRTVEEVIFNFRSTSR